MNTINTKAIQSSFPNSSGIRDLSLHEFFGLFWERRSLVLVVTALCLAISIAIALILPVKYQSTVLLSPVSDDGDSGKLGGVSSLVSQFGGLGALGGLNLSPSGRKAEAIATLQSRALTEAYISERNLLPIIFSDRWNAQKGQWNDSELEKRPTLWRANEVFEKQIRQVIEDKKTGLIKLTITWKDPYIATQWANDLVSRANQYLRQKSIDQCNRNINYLNEQLTRTSVVELQHAIYGLIEAEIKKIMIAQGSDEYAFKVIDPAVVPEQKAGPKRILIAALGLIVGLMIASILVVALQK